MFKLTFCFLLLLGSITFLHAEPPMAAEVDTATDDLTVDPDLDVQSVVDAIVERTNQFRGENELSPVATSSILNQTAMKFAQYMAENEKYGHRADGRTPAQRARANGYEYCSVLENIAYRMNTAGADVPTLSEFFVQGWIDSPPHRENMLSDFITETGVAVATTDGITFYGVQMFGRPKSAAIAVSVKNSGEDPVVLITDSESGTDEIELPTGSTLQMKRCFPTTLSIKGTEATLRVREPKKLVFDGKKFSE